MTADEAVNKEYPIYPGGVSDSRDALQLADQRTAFLKGYQAGADETRARMIQENLDLKADIARAKSGHTPPPPYTKPLRHQDKP